ncbi:MAG: hypothetical protein COA36_13220 [Desulfotalea sp.]|nr:MAG: hypothetical protein COA36_13220 [Desulfotalea sp.]
MQDQVTCRIVGVGCQAGIRGSFRYAIAKVVVGIRCCCGLIDNPNDVIMDSFGFYRAMYSIDSKEKLEDKKSVSRTPIYQAYPGYPHSSRFKTWPQTFAMLSHQNFWLKTNKSQAKTCPLSLGLPLERRTRKKNSAT